MRYAYVKNGAIVDGPRSLPSSWENISGLDKADDKFLISLGWLPYELVETSVKENQVYVAPTVEIFSDKVVETQNVRDMTTEEIENKRNQYNAMQKDRRATAYKEESDPLFFKWQRGEATESEWLDKIQEIKNRYPDQV